VIIFYQRYRGDKLIIGGRYRPVNRIFDFLKAKYIWKYSAGVVMNPSHSVVLDGGGRNTLLAEMFHDIR
jgi:hypothetical protein